MYNDDKKFIVGTMVAILLLTGYSLYLSGRNITNITTLKTETFGVLADHRDTILKIIEAVNKLNGIKK
jgi:hypothetical protein